MANEELHKLRPGGLSTAEAQFLLPVVRDFAASLERARQTLARIAANNLDTKAGLMDEEIMPPLKESDK